MKNCDGGTFLTQYAVAENRLRENNAPENDHRPQLEPAPTGIAADVPRRWSFSADGLNLYRQRAVSLSTCPAGAETRRVSPCDTTTMHTTTRRQDPATTEISFTSFTLGGFAEVNETIDRRRGYYPLLFTSFTSFSEVCGIHAGGRARPAARFSLTPLREPGERGEREGSDPTPSVDYTVHFGGISEVNEGDSFTSEGVVA